MNTKKNQSSTDDHLFRQAMDDVVPLRSPARTDSGAPKPSARKLDHEITTTLSPLDSNHLVKDPGSIDAEDGSSHRKNGVQKRILQKLKRGQFPLGDQLDLHHMNTETANRALLEFISGSRARRLESIRIIHGKGLRSERGPRLRTMTRQLLRDHPQVLAFSACKPADGGDGATDVLLKS